MRLINVHTLGLRTFADDPPPYAILSHRWTESETIYEDFVVSRIEGRSEKVQAFCAFVKRYCSIHNVTIDWAWVDTCCIDRRSSAELSEAINSMANWYKNSEFCLAYLIDVPSHKSDLETQENVRNSEWFRRGWTLQELLFPPNVIFCSADWRMLDLRKTSPLIHKITTIPTQCLAIPDLIYSESIANRMSWASARSTTRKEDEAYCLLGLFKINMPLLYGEGQNAFRRLQEEIIKQSNDESIFAWTTSENLMVTSMLASTISCFKGSGGIRQVEMHQRAPHRITNKGLEFESDALQLRQSEGSIYLIELNCYMKEDDRRTTCLIAITDLISHSTTLERTWPHSLGQQTWSLFASSRGPSSPVMKVSRRFLIRTQPRPDAERIPTQGWQLPKTRMDSLESRYEGLKLAEGKEPSRGLFAGMRPGKRAGSQESQLPRKAWTD